MKFNDTGVMTMIVTDSIFEIYCIEEAAIKLNDIYETGLRSCTGNCKDRF